MPAHVIDIVKKFFPKVESVKDATANIEIEVTKQDQNMSKRMKHNECAMAIACKRTKKLDGVIISMGTAYLIKDNKATRYTVPPSIQREVVSFDRSGIFAPGLYKLNRPQKSHRIGSISGSGKHGDRVKKAIGPKHITSGIRAALGGKNVS